MLVHRAGDIGEDTGEHLCVVVGLRAQGRLTDIWGDLLTRPDGCYVAYVPRCECGWTGPPFSNTPGGYAACEQLWRDKHLASFLRAREPHYGRPSGTWMPRVIHGGGTSEPRSSVHPRWSNRTELSPCDRDR
jgi:hypothetical protein